MIKIFLFDNFFVIEIDSMLYDFYEFFIELMN